MVTGRGRTLVILNLETYLKKNTLGNTIIKLEAQINLKM